MPFILILLISLLLLIGGIGLSKSYSQSPKKEAVTSQKIIDSSRAEIEKMLKKIESKKAPQKKMGAMCYEVAMPPEYQEYICPLDGEKTNYSRDNKETYRILRDLIEMRRIIEYINSTTNLVDLRLDETRLCDKCFPDLKSEDRYISLTSTYPDGKEHVYTKVTAEDLRILRGFFDRKLFYVTDNDGEIPLKDQTEKIRKMLGADINND